MGECVSFKCFRDLNTKLGEFADNGKTVNDDILGVFNKFCDNLSDKQVLDLANSFVLSGTQEISKELSNRFGKSAYGQINACYNVGKLLRDFVRARLTNSGNIRTAFCQAMRDPQGLDGITDVNADAISCFKPMRIWLFENGACNLGYKNSASIKVDTREIGKDQTVHTLEPLDLTAKKNISIFCRGISLQFIAQKEECEGFVEIELITPLIVDAISIKGKPPSYTAEWKNMAEGTRKLKDLFKEIKADIKTLYKESFAAADEIFQTAVANRGTFISRWKEALSTSSKDANDPMQMRRVYMDILFREIDAKIWKPGGSRKCDEQWAIFRSQFYAEDPTVEAYLRLFKENIPCPAKDNMPLASPYKISAGDPRLLQFKFLTPDEDPQWEAKNNETAAAFISTLDNGQVPEGHQCDDVKIVSVTVIPDTRETIIVYRYCPAQIWSQTNPVTGGIEGDRAGIYAAMERLTGLLNATRLPTAYSLFWPYVRNWQTNPDQEDHTIGHPPQGCKYYWPYAKGATPIGPGGPGFPPNVVPDQCFQYPLVFELGLRNDLTIDASLLLKMVQTSPFNNTEWNDTFKSKIEPRLKSINDAIDFVCG